MVFEDVVFDNDMFGIHVTIITIYNRVIKQISSNTTSHGKSVNCSPAWCLLLSCGYKGVHFRGNHSSNTTCLTHAFFGSGKCVSNYDDP